MQGLRLLAIKSAVHCILASFRTAVVSGIDYSCKAQKTLPRICSFSELHGPARTLTLTQAFGDLDGHGQHRALRALLLPLQKPRLALHLQLENVSIYSTQARGLLGRDSNTAALLLYCRVANACKSSKTVKCPLWRHHATRRLSCEVWPRLT